ARRRRQPVLEDFHPVLGAGPGEELLDLPGTYGREKLPADLVLDVGQGPGKPRSALLESEDVEPALRADRGGQRARFVEGEGRVHQRTRVAAGAAVEEA